jgi:hypothetical protein
MNAGGMGAMNTNMNTGFGGQMHNNLGMGGMDSNMNSGFGG